MDEDAVFQSALIGHRSSPIDCPLTLIGHLVTLRGSKPYSNMADMVVLLSVALFQMLTCVQLNSVLMLL